MTPNTPQDINEYKMRWMRESNYPVRVHSDLDIVGKDWCRKHLERHQWSFNSYTANYEHTFYFEDADVSKQFDLEVNQGVQS